MKMRRAYVMTGRLARMEESRARILDAAIALYIEQGIDELTLDAVAAQAGTTVQTILRIHGSRDRLFFAALEKLARAGVPLKPTAPGDVGAAVRAIFDLYETSGELILQWLGDERRHPELSATLERGRSDHRDWVKLAFGPQLESAKKAARSSLFNILVLATDIYSWSKLRKDLKLSRPEAEATVREIIEGAVGREVAHGKHSLAQLVRRREPAAELGTRARPDRARSHG